VVAALMKSFKNIGITTKLLMSFCAVILMFFIVAVYSNSVIRSMDYLYRYRMNNMVQRNVLLLEFHQELTEFRRLLKASYYSPHWIATTPNDVRREYEEYITRSFYRMGALSDKYIESVAGDGMFYLHLNMYDNHALVSKMGEIMSNAGEVYGWFYTNFFIGGTDTHYKGNVLEYTNRIESGIRYLRYIEQTVDASIQTEIENTLDLNQTITIFTISVALIISFLLAVFTVKSMDKLVKGIESSARKSMHDSSVAEANSQAKSRFLARMSHEIRTPISAVIGISEIQLQKSDLPKDIEDAFNRIYTSSSVLIGILNDVLDLSKIEAGKLDIIPAEYNVSDFLQDVLQMHVVSLENKKFKFIISIDEKLPTLLTGDVLRLKQVLNNIINNAFKYTEVGLVKFSVKCATHIKSELINMVVTIRDTGKGMTNAQVDRLLTEEYMRFHEAESPEVYGTGLGMPIVINLLELMGAQISIESHSRAGTTVTLQIPQKISSKETIGAKTAENLSRLKPASKKHDFAPVSLPHGRVLVVDDVETNLFVAKGLLGLYSLKIETCNNAVAALDKIKCGEEYDIIFMDHMMPELNGMDATKILRDMGYTRPIVALTANAFVGQAEQFLANGFDEFMAKPIITKILHEVLMKYIPKENEADEIIPEQPNEAVLDDFYGSPEIMQMVIEEFKDTQQNVIEEIKAALAEKDAETARRLSHTIKSMAAMMRNTELEATAKAVEAEIFGGGEPTAEQISALEILVRKVLDENSDS